jgi:hypothetical protein
MLAEVMMLDYILRRWREQPDLPKKAYAPIAAWQDGSAANELPLSEEIARKKARMRQIAPATFYRLFPEERESGVLG